MNVQLRQVLSDITGVSGLRIIEAILAGERDGKELAALADKRVGATQATIKKAMQGDYRAEHLFVLQSAFELRQNYQKRIHLCDEQIIAQMAQWPDRVDLEQKPAPPRKAGRAWLREMVAGKDPRQELYRRTGVDLTAIEGIGVLTAQVILSEIGLDMSAWRSEKHFASWLGLCPDNRTALGAFYRRMRARLGAASAITATAHKLARLIYRLLKHGELYIRQGLEDYENKYRQRLLHNLKKSAAAFGFELTPTQTVAQSVATSVS
jgi:transposase